MSDAVAVRDLLETVLAEHDDFAERFYRRLFELHPRTRGMFQRNSPDAQQKLFLQKLMLLVDSLEDDEALQRELGQVASTHGDYGVTAEMYDWVGGALIDVLRECAGSRWDARHEAAVRGAWATMSAIVLGHQAART